LWVFVVLPITGIVPASGVPKSLAHGRDGPPVSGETLPLHGGDSHQ
jgi:hypothetical protein